MNRYFRIKIYYSEDSANIKLDSIVLLLQKTSRPTMVSNSYKRTCEKAVFAIIYASVFVVSFIVIIKVSQYDKLDYQNAMGLSDSKWHRELTLDGETDDAQMVLRWNITNTTIVIEAVAKTTGYVGIGFSKSRSMKGADIAFGWVKDGKAFLQDCHTTHNSAPLLDVQQDYYLVHGAENDTHTVLRFTRNLTTCDAEHDLKLTKDSVKLIWIIGAEDPADELEITKQFHQPDSNNHGFRTVLLYNPTKPTLKLGNSTHFVDFTVDKVQIPGDNLTFYWCQYFKLPEFKTKNQLIGYDPLLDPNSKGVVHHILARECRGKAFFDAFENYDGPMGFECPVYTEQVMDPILGECQNILMGYAAGNEGGLYPDNVGAPLGEEFGGPSYIIMDIHYHNPKHLSGIIDSSGLRFYYSSQPRKYDTGVLVTGHVVSALSIIPPGQQNFPIIGYCPGVCLNEDIPETGIRLLMVLLHAHLLATKIIVRHFRDGVELPPIAKDENFEFDYQEGRFFQEEITVLRNDTISVECYYDTTSQTKTVMGGRKSTDEMCMAFLAYYPKIMRHLCLTVYPTQDVIEAMGAKLASDAVTVIDERNQGKSAEDFAKTFNWTDSIVEDFHHYVMQGERVPMCTSDGPMTLIKVPHRFSRPSFVEYQQPDTKCVQP